MEYKLIALDIDGTLFNSSQEIMPMTRKKLIELQQQGTSIVLASGRDISSLSSIGKQLKMDQYPQNGYLCLNGLEIYDSSYRLIHNEKKLTKEDALILDEYAKEFCMDMIFFFAKGLFIIEHGHTGIIEHHFMTRCKEKILSVDEIPHDYFDDLRKVAFVQNRERMSQIKKDVYQKVGSLFEVTLVEPDWIEINPLGLNKGHALEIFCQLKNISIDKTIAFGNGENDIHMLKCAGKGIAMGNSFDSVQEIADDICLRADEDGIGEYLKRDE